jgi:hypothetical protein
MEHYIIKFVLAAFTLTLFLHSCDAFTFGFDKPIVCCGYGQTLCLSLFPSLACPQVTLPNNISSVILGSYYITPTSGVGKFTNVVDSLFANVTGKLTALSCEPSGCEANFPDSLSLSQFVGYSSYCTCTIINASSATQVELKDGNYDNVQSYGFLFMSALESTFVSIGRYGSGLLSLNQDINEDSSQSEQELARGGDDHVFSRYEEQCVTKVKSNWPKTYSININYNNPPSYIWQVVVTKEGGWVQFDCQGYFCNILLPKYYFDTAGPMVVDVKLPPNVCSSTTLVSNGKSYCRESDCTWSCPIQLYKHHDCITTSESAVLWTMTVLLLLISLVLIIFWRKVWCWFKICLGYGKATVSAPKDVAVKVYNSPMVEACSSMWCRIKTFFGFKSSIKSSEMHTMGSGNQTKRFSGNSSKSMYALVVLMLLKSVGAAPISCTVTCPEEFFDYVKHEPPAVSNYIYISTILLIVLVISYLPLILSLLKWVLYAFCCLPNSFMTTYYDLKKNYYLAKSKPEEKAEVYSDHISSVNRGQQCLVATYGFALTLIVFLIVPIKALSLEESTIVIPDTFECAAAYVTPSDLTSCTTDSSGLETCYSTFQIEVDLAPRRTTCISIDDSEGNNVAEMSIYYQEVLAYAQLNFLYYTSDWGYNEQSVYKCVGGQCDGTLCDAYNIASSPSSVDKMQPPVTNYPGIQQCNRNKGQSTCANVAWVEPCCSSSKDGCIYYANGIYSTGDIYAVYSISNIVYKPKLFISVSDVASNAMVETVELTGSPPVAVLDEFTFSYIGTYSFPQTQFGTNKLIYNMGNLSAFLSPASEVGSPKATTIGDIQAQLVSRLTSPSRTSFAFDRNLFSISLQKSSASATRILPGILQKVNGIPLPGQFSGDIWSFDGENLIGNISQPGLLKVNIATNGQGYQVTTTSSLVCPEVENFLNATGCHNCESGSIMYAEFTSACKAGFAYLSVDVDYVVLGMNSIYLPEGINTIWGIRFKTTRSENKFTVTITDDTGKYSESFVVEYVAYQDIHNDTLFNVPDDANSTKKHKKDSSTGDGSWGVDIRHFFKDIFNGVASWWEYVVFLITIVITVTVLTYLFRFIKVIWPKGKDMKESKRS